LFTVYIILPYELIVSCEIDDLYRQLETLTGDVYVGMDIGRKKDLSVIWILEKLGRVNYTRMVKILEKTPFKIQEEVLHNILGHRNLRRCCIDSTGLGMQLAENAQQKFSKYRVEAITFTNKVKEGKLLKRLCRKGKPLSSLKKDLSRP
jgi:phage FluMu gp28-like protein